MLYPARRRPIYPQHGLTLIELLISLAILSMLLGLALPITRDWVYSNQTRDARGKLVLAYGLVKSLAMRNPAGVSSGSVAAGLRFEVRSSVVSVLVCQGDPTVSVAGSGAKVCTDGGNAVVWKAEFPSGVAMSLGGVLVSAASAGTLALSNRGLPLAATDYLISRGVSANDESGSLY